MSLPGCSVCVRLCTALQEWPAAVLCISIAFLQMAVMDYYLIHHLGLSHLSWLSFDAVNITLLVVTIHQARTTILESEKEASRFMRVASGSFGWLTWLSMSIAVAAKSVVIFHIFADKLDEASSFFGPNTLKTTIALGSCTFLLLLMTQHNAPPGSEGRRYIAELTGTVVFDILDTVDILEVLFHSDARARLWAGLEEFILAVAVLNLTLPTVPLFTLARCKFGEKKLSINLVHGHRILCVLAVNMPNLMVRVLLWHGMSSGVSPFALKNILAILLTFYDIYEHNKEEFEKRESKEENKTSQCEPFKPKKIQRNDHGSDCNDFQLSRENGLSLPIESVVDTPTPYTYSDSGDGNGKSKHKRDKGYIRERNYKNEGSKENNRGCETISSGGSDANDSHDNFMQNPSSHVNTTSV